MPATKQPSTAPRTLRDVSPDHAALLDKLAEFELREAELVARGNALTQSLARAGALQAVAAHISVPPEVPEAPKPISVRPSVAALLGEDLTPAPRLPEATPRRHDGALAEYHRIGHELAAIRDAKAVLLEVPIGKRHSLYEQSRISASEKLCEYLKPEYDVLASNYANALHALGDAIAAHENFVRQNLAGVAWTSLRPARMPEFLGFHESPVAAIKLLLDWCVEQKHFERRS